MGSGMGWRRYLLFRNTLVPEEPIKAPPSYFDMMNFDRDNFPPTPPSEKFISGVSVTLLVVLILCFRSSATPFLSPMDEMRRLPSSTYMNIIFHLFLWVLSATALTVVPHFSSHYNIIIAAALFFPMLFISVGALVFGRFLVRLLYYSFYSCKKYKKGSQHAGGRLRILEGRLVSFHRPFRKLMTTSAFLSTGLCFLYAHCWSRDLEAFKIDAIDGAGAVCRAVFSPFVFGGWVPRESKGADETSIWVIWTSVIVCLLASFLLDEFEGKHFMSPIGPASAKESKALFEDEKTINDDLYSDEEYFILDKESDTESESESEGEQVKIERPKDTLPMVEWYSLLLVTTVFDILIELKVFLGRFDARALMNTTALVDSDMHFNRQYRTKGQSASSEYDALQFPEGTVFDCRPNTTEEESDVWFDFTADCGDGFDSSYQVSRMLAQPQLPVKQKSGSIRILPRGSFLVVGGDLAYPHPDSESYEKRFFCTFEDAMPPPPSFRREKISINKPSLPVKGWKGCFGSEGTNKENGRRDKQVKLYKGPKVFCIPGNHDWYDGLATYSRYILSRDWLGGWLMPQQRSYFALRLPHGWWLLAFDHGLSQDIDLNQFKFFVKIAKEMKETDSCILVQHEPSWVTNADEKRTTAETLPEDNLRELITHYLGHRVRARLAGDLHHYTRHIPAESELQKKRHRHPSRHDSKCAGTLPELIVSGGGGAFLHGTHTYDNMIGVGPDQDKYARVCAYPDEKTSVRLSWLNLWQFRWRNWRFDMVGAATYFGVASSFFPLCGVYADYLAFNPTSNPLLPVPWLARTVFSLLLEVFSSGRVSAIFAVFVFVTLYSITDPKLKSTTRLFWGLAHGAIQISAAFACLVFVECLVEWSIHEGIVKIASAATKKVQRNEEGINLASSLYEEYKEHFFTFFSDMAQPPVLSETHHPIFTPFQEFHAKAYDRTATVCYWIYTHVPLLKTTLAVFDLPGSLAQKHSDICEILCSGGVECFTRHDYSLFLQVERGSVVAYLGAISLYFFILAIPLSGNMFGAWLALTLTLLRAQINEGFSSLRYEHFKNFLRLHVTKDGDLEIFAIGLNKVPKRWVKDPLWEGSTEEVSSRRNRSGLLYEDGGFRKPITPSWSWDRPSKWTPERHSKRFDPEIIDYTLILKTEEK